MQELEARIKELETINEEHRKLNGELRVKLEQRRDNMNESKQVNLMETNFKYNLLVEALLNMAFLDWNKEIMAFPSDNINDILKLLEKNKWSIKLEELKAMKQNTNN